jgi:hypothetical protein
MQPSIFAAAAVSLLAVSALSAAARQAAPPPPPKGDVLIVQAIDVTPRPAAGATAPSTVSPQPTNTVPRSSLEPAAFAAQPPGPAGPAPRPPAPGEWKLEDIDAEVRRIPGEWMLEVEFEVRQKTKNALSGAPTTLFLALRESGAPVLNADGSPFGFEIPLDRPKKAEKRKREFEGTVRHSFGDSYHGDLEALEIVAWIELDQTGERLAEDTVEVDFDDGDSHGFGISIFGFGVSW